MAGKVSTYVDRSLFTRRCVACGYDGALLRGGQACRCARCGCDLRRRPARSYAEMEGLVGQPVMIDVPRELVRRSPRLVVRWLAFAVMTVAGFSALLWLAQATFTL